MQRAAPPSSYARVVRGGHPVQGGEGTLPACSELIQQSPAGLDLRSSSAPFSNQSPRKQEKKRGPLAKLLFSSSLCTIYTSFVATAVSIGFTFFQQCACLTSRAVRIHATNRRTWQTKPSPRSTFAVEDPNRTRAILERVGSRRCLAQPSAAPAAAQPPAATLHDFCA